jgi:hypothetical protein
MSPQVWADARPRIQAVIAAQGIAASWPNEDFTRPDQPAIWLAVEFSSNADVPIEIGANTWQENGALLLHLMLPRGVGIDKALALKDALSVAFRGVTDAAIGLAYREQSTDPIADGTDDGIYRRMSLWVRYAYQSQLAG